MGKRVEMLQIELRGEHANQYHLADYFASLYHDNSPRIILTAQKRDSFHSGIECTTHQRCLRFW